MKGISLVGSQKSEVGSQSLSSVFCFACWWADAETRAPEPEVAKAIYMEVAVAPGQKLTEEGHVVKICEEKSNLLTQP